MILFRRLLRPQPKNRTTGQYWQVEFHDDAVERGFPLGVGFVSVIPGGTKGHSHIVLTFVLVADQYRRKGIATAIIEAARGRWPNIVLTDAVTKAGGALLRSL